MKKKVVATISIISIISIGAWFFLRETSVTDKQIEKNSSINKGDALSNEKTEWLKTTDLNQKAGEKLTATNDQKSVQESGVEAPPTALDERIGKEDPSMVEHFNAEDLPPLDMMSVEEQEKINREMRVKPEDVGKGINEAEMNPNVDEINKNIDMKEMNPDIKEIEKLLEKTK